jgi:Ankyrin repeats (3 copies)
VKKGCAFGLVLWLGLVGVYGYVAWGKVHEPIPAAMVGVLGGTFAAMLVSSFVGLFTGAGDRGALKRAIASEPPRDGRLEAAAGSIRPFGAPLHAPFTGRPCVAYEYNVKNRDAGRSDFAGVALAPCAVHGHQGPARILGWSVLDPFGNSGRDEIDLARGKAYLESATFEKLSLASMLSVLGALLADDDGSIRKDYRIAEGPPDLEGKKIEEKIVSVGAQVTILGRWSAAHGGFAPAGSMSMNRMFPGDLPTTLRNVGGASVKTFVIGLVFFLALHAILVPMFFLAPKRDKAGQILPKHPSVWDERDCVRQKELLAAGADPNERNQGRTALMNAAREGEVACVVNLLAAHARIEDVDQNGDTALAEAVSAGREDSIAVLRKAGAKDFRVTSENGRPLTEGSEPFGIVKAYAAAVHAADFPTMASLVPGTSVKFMKERKEDLAFWQSLRPKEPKLREGWMTDDAATLTITGATPGGERVVAYHLQKSFEGWRIFREWFPEPPAHP